MAGVFLPMRLPNPNAMDFRKCGRASGNWAESSKCPANRRRELRSAFRFRRGKICAPGNTALNDMRIQWYEPLAHTTEYRRGAILETDANGRLLPAPNRFPMTKDSRSFKPIADYLHDHGLKFGLHPMRGIPRQAVDRDN